MPIPAHRTSLRARGLEVSLERSTTSGEGCCLIRAVVRAGATTALIALGLAVQPDGRGLLLGFVLVAVVAAWARPTRP